MHGLDQTIPLVLLRVCRCPTIILNQRTDIRGFRRHASHVASFRPDLIRILEKHPRIALDRPAESIASAIAHELIDRRVVPGAIDVFQPGRIRCMNNSLDYKLMPLRTCSLD